VAELATSNGIAKCAWQDSNLRPLRASSWVYGRMNAAVGYRHRTSSCERRSRVAPGRRSDLARKQDHFRFARAALANEVRAVRVLRNMIRDVHRRPECIACTFERRIDGTRVDPEGGILDPTKCASRAIPEDRPTWWRGVHRSTRFKQLGKAFWYPHVARSVRLGFVDCPLKHALRLHPPNVGLHRRTCVCRAVLGRRSGGRRRYGQFLSFHGCGGRGTPKT
jgi:hypothetical protein